MLDNEIRFLRESRRELILERTSMSELWASAFYIKRNRRRIVLWSTRCNRLLSVKGSGVKTQGNSG